LLISEVKTGKKETDVPKETPKKEIPESCSAHEQTQGKKGLLIILNSYKAISIGLLRMPLTLILTYHFESNPKNKNKNENKYNHGREK